jgi:Flp pilus assembly protein TadG
MKTRKRESGVSLVATGIWIFALIALMAGAIEVARLTDTATEVQVSADAAALGAATAMSRGLSPQAVTIGQSAAASNFADGRTVDSSGVQIDIGHYDSDPTANPHFTAACTPGTDCNGARATVTVNNVRFIVASILNGQTGTAVQKNAVAAALCQGSGYPLPLAVCEQALQQIPQDDTCGPVSGPFTMNPNTGQSACWTSLDASAASSSNYDQGIFPAACGGTPVEAFTQEPINLQNGVADSVWKALQCCIACQNLHDFIVPVVDCAAVGNCNTAPPILGFATIHIASALDVQHGNGNTQCNNSLSPWGSCGVTINNAGSTGITASQICKTDVAGRPGANCINFANTVAPVLGQLP